MWQHWWRKRKAQRLQWDRRLQQSVVARLPTLAAMPATAHARLAELSAEFLVDKQFYGAQGFELEQRHLLTIATLACWPVLRLGYGPLCGWHQIIVYPGDFRARRSVDEASGDFSIVHEYDDELSGEAWEHGPLIVGWESIEEELADPEAGCSVVIHEIAHKLDAGSGAINGMPPLPKSIPIAQWSAELGAAYADFRARVEQGVETEIDPYAAEAPEEFFAVCSEYYCLRPDLLRAALPQVHRQLGLYYGEISAETATT